MISSIQQKLSAVSTQTTHTTDSLNPTVETPNAQRSRSSSSPSLTNRSENQNNSAQFRAQQQMRGANLVKELERTKRIIEAKPVEASGIHLIATNYVARTLLENKDSFSKPGLVQPKSPLKAVSFNLKDVFSDSSFTAKNIKEYAAELLGIDQDKVVDVLHESLPFEKQTDENKQLIKDSISQSVDASSAVVMVINTDQGLRLIAANSQRPNRNMLFQTNGTCEKGESMKDTGSREFLEELANPNTDSIFYEVLNNSPRSIHGTNKIGTTASEIAENIINKNNLYLNVGALYTNSVPVSLDTLNAELNTLNQKLQKTKNYYKDAVNLIFGDKENAFKPADLNDKSIQKKALEIINKFKQNCAESITSNFLESFDFEETQNPELAAQIKKALKAIIDLSENDRIELVDKDFLISARELLNTDKPNFEKSYFAPAFEQAASLIKNSDLGLL
jgi:hypothetical protein